MKFKIDSKNRDKVIYILIIIICIIALLSTIIYQIVDIIKTNKGEKTSIGKLPEVAIESKVLAKQKFDEIFTNDVNYLEDNEYKITKIQKEKEIIFTGYGKKEVEEGLYEIDVNIPFINIRNDVIKKYNNEIKTIFKDKVDEIKRDKKENVIYTVKYSTYISHNILSLVIRSTIKEGADPQRDIIKTYNYNLEERNKVTIDYLLDLKGINKNDGTKIIREEIKKEQQRVEALGSVGLQVFPRDYTNDMYSINNVTEYFLGENNILYIIYAYGNNNKTYEKDIVTM